MRDPKHQIEQASWKRLSLVALIAAAMSAIGPEPSVSFSRLTLRQVLDTVESAERAFFAKWLAVWKASQLEQHYLDPCGPGGCPWSPRVTAVHCHPESKTAPLVLVDQQRLTPRPNPRYIDPERFVNSGHTAFALCPTWYPGTYPPDERGRIDFALTARHRDSIGGARALLIGLIRRAHEAYPESDFLTGQLVRFLVDQTDFAGAATAATGCRATNWWCLALQGYVAGRTLQFVRADSLFAGSVRAMPDSIRCSWTDLTLLLDDAARRRYRTLPCDRRDSANAQIWWLADPLFLEPGNERRTEHYIRHVVITLHAALDRDERFLQADALGNDARRNTIVRFGWPTYLYWAGVEHDTEHTFWLDKRKSPRNEPYTTYEYSRGRVHTVPSNRALTQPFSAVTDDWELTEAQKKTDDIWSNRPWWPREHAATHAPLVQLHDPQVAMFRRQSDVLVAAAVDLDPERISRSATEFVRLIALVESPAPDSVRVIARRDGYAGAAVALWGQVAPRPTMIGIEFPATSMTRPGARTRFGLTPIQPLSALAPGARAISDPAVLVALGDGTAPRAQTDSALNHMAGSHVVQPVGRIGVYWETYGFVPTDSMEFSVWLERYSRQGIARRFARTLGVAEDLNTPVVVSWTEAPANRNIHVIPGAVTIIGRTLSIDVSRLARGDYWLDVAARAPGSEVVRGRTRITVQ